MKICKDCGQEKKQIEFYGVQGECKKCTQKRVSKNYQKNREYYAEYDRKRGEKLERKLLRLGYSKKHREKYPGKKRARNKITNALKYGRIIKEKCEKCDSEKVEAHHDDYRRYLKVRWLCKKHHWELNNFLKLLNGVKLFK